MSIVITAPSGTIGRQLVTRLLDAGRKDLVLIARNPEKVADLEERGARVVQGDLTDEKFVVNVTQGAEALFWLTPPNLSAENYREYQNRLGDIATRAIVTNNINYVVHLSSLGAHICTDTGPIDGLCDIEQKFNQVAKNVVHLRPASFFENFIWQLESIKSDGNVYLPINGDIATPMVATRDIADTAYRYLNKFDWTGQNIHELLGPKDISYNDAAEYLSKVLGVNVNFVSVPYDAARESFIQMGASKDVADNYIRMYQGLNSGYLTGEYPRSSQSTTKTTFETFLRDVVLPIYEE